MAFTLPRIPPNLVSPDFQVWWQQVVEAIEAQEETQNGLITDILLALASISEVAPITIAADYTGTVNPSEQLPLDIAIKRYSGDTDVTSTTAWSCTPSSGITATIGASTGILDIAAVSASGTVLVTSLYQGITKTRLVSITRTVGAPPTTGAGGGGGGSGGTTATDTTFNTINSTSHAAISDELIVTVGSTGDVDLNAALSVYTAASGVSATYPVLGLWRWWDGAAWQDVGTEVQSDPDAEIVTDLPNPAVLYPGTLNVSTTKSGLTPTNSEKFQLYARKNTGTRVMSFSGSASAIG
jgi:hypothetical protein